jgi:hypothetical protein
LEFDAFVAKEISRSSAPEIHRSNAATSISGIPWPVRNSFVIKNPPVSAYFGNTLAENWLGPFRG